MLRKLAERVGFAAAGYIYVHDDGYYEYYQCTWHHQRSVRSFLAQASIIIDATRGGRELTAEGFSKYEYSVVIRNWINSGGLASRDRHRDGWRSILGPWVDRVGTSPSCWLVGPGSFSPLEIQIFSSLLRNEVLRRRSRYVRNTLAENLVQKALFCALIGQGRTREC